MASESADKDSNKTINPADDFPSSRPGPKTAIGAAILLIGGLVIFYW